MQRGAIHYLPATGRALILADLHGEKEYLTQAMTASGFDVKTDYLVLLGDVVDSMRNRDDKSLVDHIFELKVQNPENVVYLMGNHEWESMLRYQHEVDHDSRFTFWGKMDDHHLSVLQRLPYFAQTQNGFLLAHHGPLSDLKKEVLESYVEDNSVDRSLGGRLFYDVKEDEEQLTQMLSNLGAQYFISGHRFAPKFQKVFSQWGRLGTIHASQPSALIIDLQKKYTSIDEIEVLSL